METKPNDFWYTPPYVLDCVKAFMPKYFDPCPINPNFNGLGKDDDGLEYWWPTDCFINPPYSEKLKRSFIQQGIKQFNASSHHRYIWLMNYANTVDLWDLQTRASAVCIPQYRVRFVPGHPLLAGHPENPDPDKRKPGSPQYDNIFILWGDPKGFAEAFKGLGVIYTKGSDSI